MRLVGLKVLEEGHHGRIEVTVQDDNGSQAVFQYSGNVYSNLIADSSGYFTASVTVTAYKVESVAPNSPRVRFDS